MRVSKTTIKVIAGVLVGIMVGGAGAVVMASIPDTNQVYHGCYRTSTGALRVIDTAIGQACNANENAITWNQVGPQGIPGQDGAPGSGGPGSLLSNLVGVDFTGASLQNRDLTNLDFHDSDFANAVLTGSDLTGSNLSGVMFESTMLKNADLHGDNLSGSTFRYGFRAVGTNFSGADFTNARIQGSTALFTGPTDLTNANFQQAIFTGTAFESSPNCGPDCTYFKGGDFTTAHFLNATLSGAHLIDANFTGATWQNTICPDGTNSDNNGNTCDGHGL